MSSDLAEEGGELPEPCYTWTTNSELALFQALISHKPAGINKHFSMAIVSELLCEELGPEVTSQAVWAKLRTMFDLTAVDDREDVIPFPLDEREFTLPRREYFSLISDKQKDIVKDSKVGPSKAGKVSVVRMPSDMGSDKGKEKQESPKLSKAEVKIEKVEEVTKPSKRHVTRSTPGNTPAKKRK